MLTETNRLSLDRPTAEDVEGLHEIFSDPRVWAHLPSQRHSSLEKTRVILESWKGAWERDALGPWVVRAAGEPTIIGYGGCSVKQNAFWNLGYRFAVEAQGRGYATEVSFEAMKQAQRSRLDLPVVAYLLDHNTASARVAEKIGLTLAYRGIDSGNPDPDAIRLVYADRELGSEELALIIQ